MYSLLKAYGGNDEIGSYIMWKGDVVQTYPAALKHKKKSWKRKAI